MRWSLLIGAALTGAVPATADPAAAPVLPELQAVWALVDLNTDQLVTLPEAELALTNPRFEGGQAAAVAALRRGLRGLKLAPVTLPQIAASLPYQADAKPPTPPWQSYYDDALKRINGSRRELFVSGGPRLETVSQGRLGDCFALAALGSTVARDPQRVVKMMALLPDQRVQVTFGARQVTVVLPTPAEVALGATSCGDGLWVNVYEKALGALLLERQKEPKHLTPFSIITLGGSPNTALEFITGHYVKRVSCDLFRPDKPATRQQQLARLDQIRQELLAAERDGRLFVGGNGPLKSQLKVPGIVYNHSYGVLDYEPRDDSVLFWNPFGHTFTPRGEAGLKHGYPTAHGQFRVPLTEAVQWFSSFSIETTLPPRY
ncbi:MAG: hypothetical protein IT204_11420 [Fimbriimonadaceae bacterium]|nr:hypothetical protein [Fimbriimonadaceae bacterium]